MIGGVGRRVKASRGQLGDGCRDAADNFCKSDVTIKPSAFAANVSVICVSLVNSAKALRCDQELERRLGRFATRA